MSLPVGELVVLVVLLTIVMIGRAVMRSARSAEPNRTSDRRHRCPDAGCRHLNPAQARFCGKCGRCLDANSPDVTG